jgi:16S rRNA (cytidine1402-2'-O)-methyltransferase
MVEVPTGTIRQWYNKGPRLMSGRLFVVATPIGNLEDISARALRILREVSLIAAEDTRRTAHLLSRYAITTPTTSLHEHNESSKSARLIERLRAGGDIALVSDAGTPGVSDPGRRLVAAALASGIRVEPIPGPSAVLAALMASGFPSDTFTFLGFPPTRSTDRSRWFAALRGAGHTVVFFEAPHRLVETLRQVQSSLGDVKVAIGREMTKAHEELVVGPIFDVIEALPEPVGEFTIVVNIGRMTNIVERRLASDAELAAEFGELTDNNALSRRRAVNTLARRHGRTPNEVYAALERGKKSVE